MGKNITITEADRQAAARLKAIWRAQTPRLSQQKIADAWVGQKEANQSLISQYINGKIALNYKALLFFAHIFGVPETDIRSDLPEQQLGAESGMRVREPSQPAGPDEAKMRESIQFLRDLFDHRGKAFSVEAQLGLVLEVYNSLVATSAPNWVVLADTFGKRLDGDEHERKGEVGGVGKDDRGGAGRRPRKTATAADRS